MNGLEELDELSNVDFIKKEYQENDICMSELIRYYIYFFGRLTIGEIRELLLWTGDDEYITAEELYEECS